MSTLGHAHGNAFLRSFGAGNADEAEHNVVAGRDRVREECQLIARRIREDGFEDEAFTLSDEFLSKSPSLVIVRLHPAMRKAPAARVSRPSCRTFD